VLVLNKWARFEHFIGIYVKLTRFLGNRPVSGPPIFLFNQLIFCWAGVELCCIKIGHLATVSGASDEDDDEVK
jgi:hypothetical protein